MLPCVSNKSQITSKCGKNTRSDSRVCHCRPLPTLAITKKAISRYLLSKQNEAISLVAMRNKEL